jgi:UDP:flavonoid glycosyltransferase YjiC (YdhE family)
MKKKKILVAPLNWGLGHAARCIPLINALCAQGAEVILASDGGADKLLKQEFPHLTTLTLPAYDITYKTENMFLNMGLQVWKIAWAAYKEHQLIQQIVEQEQIAILISDNRFGCFSKKVTSIFMTHQLNILTPYTWMSAPVRWLNHFFIRRFDACWIPDEADETNNLSGVLAHGKSGRLPSVTYLGVLSRMQKMELPQRYDVIVILSGPEPQRTILQDKILAQAKDLSLQFLVVQGLTQEKKHFFIAKNIEIVSYLTTRDLNEAIAKSGVIVSRSGYTTLMDLAILGKPAILIPTPGQTEQEYLAKYFYEKKIFFSQTQKDFNLGFALEKIKDYNGFSENHYTSMQLEKAVASIV